MLLGVKDIDIGFGQYYVQLVCLFYWVDQVEVVIVVCVCVGVDIVVMQCVVVFYCGLGIFGFDFEVVVMMKFGYQFGFVYVWEVFQWFVGQVVEGFCLWCDFFQEMFELLLLMLFDCFVGYQV